MIIFLNRIKEKYLRWYRKSYFKAFTKTKNNINIVGKINLINPNIKVGKNVTIYPDVMFFGDGNIEIGDNVDIGNGTVIYASKSGGVKIGDNSMIAAQCYIIDMDHGFEENTLIREQKNTVSPVVIGADCWISAGCKILKGSTINDGAVIGASAVVKGEIPENAIAVGIPAKVKRIRS